MRRRGMQGRVNVLGVRMNEANQTNTRRGNEKKIFTISGLMWCVCVCVRQRRQLVIIDSCELLRV